MKFGIYSIQDVKTGFMTPTIDQNDFSAGRNFSSAVMQSDGVLFTHAEDFRLFKIGEFESDTGVIQPISPIELIIDGSSVLRGKKDGI